MDLTVEKRDRLVELLASEYTVPEECVDCVKAAVKQYATKNYSDEAIEKMVMTPQSLSKGLALLRERNGKIDLSLFRGIISEWLVCAEYNAMKNKGSVIMTITNSDPSSKADLLHIIDTGHGYKAVPGPDVKSGGSTYVFNQWKKIVNERYEIPMVDIDGNLTTEDGLKQLTKKQRSEFDELCEKYPNKRPVVSTFDKSDINRLVADYLKFVEFEILPSSHSEFSIADINVQSLKEKLYSGKFPPLSSYEFTYYSEQSKDILYLADQSELSHAESMSLEKRGDSIDVGSSSMNVVKSKKTSNMFLRIVESAAKSAIKVGNNVVQWGIRNPEVVGAIAIGVVKLVASYDNKSIEYEDGEHSGENLGTFYDDNNIFDFGTESSYDSTSPLFEPSQNYNVEHNYPENRKSPLAHPLRRNGIVIGARGGTEEERAAIRKEHGLE